MKKHITATHKILIKLLLFCILLLFIRMKLTETFHYAFLIWNLFLALVPYAISQILKQQKNIKYGGLFIWLLFLPNAPYIITDFIHLHKTSSETVWLDLFLLFSYANTGLLLALLSLYDVYVVLRRKLSRIVTRNCILTATFLSGFGIYLGRFLRLNSWEVFTNPSGVLFHVYQSLQETTVWAITIGMGTFLWILFLTFKTIKESYVHSSFISNIPN